jgi:serine protease Do
MVTQSSRFIRKSKIASLVAVGSLAAGLGMSLTPAMAADGQGGDAAAGRQQLLNMQAAIIDIAAKVEPAVVHIQAEIQPQNNGGGDDAAPMMPFNLPFGGPAPRSRPGLASGSGVIIDANGTIITNRHVVENARRVTVTLTDHRIFQGTAYSDPNIDLAVVQIHPNGPLPFVPVADSSRVHIGDWAFAIGYPFDVGESVSKGIISALGRSQTIEGKFYPNLLQTDASINPGNSGGALVNINGELIGINTAIAGAAGQSAGIGFAIPSATVQAVWPQLAGPNHKITNYPKGWIRGKLGVEVRPVTPDLFSVLGVNQGALVASVQPDSAAARGGIQAGDVITRINDQPIRDSQELVDAISDVGPNQTVTVSVVRDKKNLTRNVTTGSFAETTPAIASNVNSGKLGLSLQSLTTETRQDLKLPNDVRHGVVVGAVQAGSPAEAAGFQQGDVIVQVNDTPVASPADFSNAVAGAKAGDSLGVKVYRGSTTAYLVIQVPDNNQAQ